MGLELFSELVEAAEQAKSPVSTYARMLIAKNANVHAQGKIGDRNSGLQATFRGGKGSPLHDWYPYLEGYSPDFVRSIITTFAPAA